VYVAAATVAGERVSNSSASEGFAQNSSRSTLVLVRSLQHDADSQTRYRLGGVIIIIIIIIIYDFDVLTLNYFFQLSTLR